jgi:hypothetical protein
MVLVRENNYLHDVKVSICLVDAHDESILLVKLVFRHVEGFKMIQRASVKLHVKLKETSTAIFKMLKSAYGEECLSRTTVFE